MTKNNDFWRAWRQASTIKRPPFPKGCAVILYATASLREVAEVLGYSQFAVHYHLRRAGVKTRCRGGVQKACCRTEDYKKLSRKIKRILENANRARKRGNVSLAAKHRHHAQQYIDQRRNIEASP